MWARTGRCLGGDSEAAFMLSPSSWVMPLGTPLPSWAQPWPACISAGPAGRQPGLWDDPGCPQPPACSLQGGTATYCFKLVLPHWAAHLSLLLPHTIICWAVQQIPIKGDFPSDWDFIRSQCFAGCQSESIRQLLCQHTAQEAQCFAECSSFQGHLGVHVLKNRTLATNLASASERNSCSVHSTLG